jgi:2-polyprenyl-3-methyl-5-hydroxy-6-metoxy-1,4-benzoquinol methylase
VKYGVGASNPLESLALLLGKVPVPVLDALMPLMKARSILTAVELGVFEALREGALDAMEVAQRRNLDAEATELLLRTLVASGYLKQEGDLYELSAGTRRTLLEGAENELWGFTLWNAHQWKTIAGLEHLLQTGEGIDLHGTLDDPELWARYQRAMLEIARFQAKSLARHIPVPQGAKRLLDIAGSHGLFAAEICRRHQGLRGEVLELPSALEAARKLAQEEGIAALVEHREGDLRQGDFGQEEIDVVVLANILHHFQAAENIDLLRRAKAALVRGGSIAIWEIDVPASGSKADIGDLGALFFRLTSNARAWRAEDYAAWLSVAGFREVKVKRILTLPGNVLVRGKR